MGIIDTYVPHAYDGVVPRNTERLVGGTLGLVGAGLTWARFLPPIIGVPLTLLGAAILGHGLTRLDPLSFDAHVQQSMDAGRVTATGKSWINPDIERITADMPPEVRARLMDPNWRP